MPRDEYTSNSQQNITGVPPLVSHIHRQLRHVGEGTGRLARWVIGHGSLALSISQAARLPVISRAFDYIRSKAIVDSPVWQRPLDLPWFPGHLLRKRRPAETRRSIAGRKWDISPHPDGLHTDIRHQTFTDAGEPQTDYEVVETYPLINTELLSPPPAVRRLLETTGNFPPVASDNVLPLHTKKIPDRRYLKGPGEPRIFTTKKEKNRTAGEGYPVIMENLPSTSESKLRTPEADSERPHHTRVSSSSMSPETRQDMGGPEVESGAETTTPQAERSGRVIIPDIHRDYQIPKDDTRPTGTSERKPDAAIRQPRHTYLSQKLSRVLKPITQRMPFRHPPLELHPQMAGEGESETQSSDVLNIGVSVEPTRQTVQQFHPLASSKQAAMLKPESLLHALPALSRSRISRVVLKLASLPIITRKAKEPGRLAINTIPPEAYSEAHEIHPGETYLPLASQTEQAMRQRQGEKPSVEPGGQNTATGDEAASVARVRQSSDTIIPVTPKHDSIGWSVTQGHINRTLISREPLSLGGRPSVIPINKLYAQNVPFDQLFKSEAEIPLGNKDKSDRYPYGQEYTTFSPGGAYSRQPAGELPYAASTEPNGRFSSAPGKELLTNIHSSIPELTAPRYTDTPDLALAQVGSAPATSSFRAAGEETRSAGDSEQEDESLKTPDIDAIASDVYGILKRRLMAERERALGVY